MQALSKALLLSVILISVALMGLVASPGPALAFDEPTDTGHPGAGEGTNQGQESDTPTSNPNQSSGGDPVILSTGDFTHELLDIYIPGRLPLEITRSYHSQDKYNGPFGHGWTFNYNISLVETVDRGKHSEPGTRVILYEVTKIIIRDGDSIRLEFTDSGSSVFTPPPGRFESLNREGDGFVFREKNGTKYHFDGAGRLTSIEDRNGNQLTLAYDVDGKLTSVTDDAGRSLTFTYNAKNKVQTITDPAGRVVSYSYDADENLIEVANPAGHTITYSYDLDHNLISVANTKGYIFLSNVYDSLHRVVSQVYNGGTLTFSYDDKNRVTTLTDRQGTVSETTMNETGNPVKIIRDVGGLNLTTTFVYDQNMSVVSIADPDGSVTEYTYDEAGNIFITTDPLGGVTTIAYEPNYNRFASFTNPRGKTVFFTYDTRGNLIARTDPYGNETIYTVNEKGDLISMTDRNGKITTFDYDANGYLSMITDPEGMVTTMAFDDVGNLQEIVRGVGTPEQQTTAYTYDNLDQITSVTDGTGTVTRFTYNDIGKVTSVQDATSRLTTFTYDEKNSLVRVDNTVSGELRFEYDEEGRIVSRSDSLERTAALSYDALGRLTMTTNAMGGTQLFSWDQKDNLISFTNALGKATTFDHDALGNMTEFTNPLNQSTQLTYDPAGNLKTVTDPEGRLITYTYDDLSRLVQVVTPDNTITYTYDAVGNLLTAQDNDSSLAFSYDGNNRQVTAQTIDVGNQPGITLTYSYDSHNNVVQMADSLGGVSQFEFDLANRLTKLTTSASDIITMAHDNAGRLLDIFFPNTVRSQLTYSAAGRLNSLSHSVGQTTSLENRTYTYNSTGNILTITESAGVSSYQYDALQRLVAGGMTTAPESYAYDSLGNRVTSFLSATHSHDDANRILEDDNNIYSYDGAGNLISKTAKNGGGETTYTWDAQNQLVEIVFPDATTATYRYDAIGRRIEKNVNGTVTRYVYDADHPVLEFDGANSLLARNNFGDRVDQILSSEKNGQSYFYLTDHLGSVRMLTDQGGSVVASYDYDSFGRIINASESVPSSFKYIGREYDQESGLHYFRARYYDPQLGRFISADPVGFMGGDSNLYNYVHGSPIMRKDSSGLLDDELEDIMVGEGRGYLEGQARDEMIKAALVRLGAEGASGPVGWAFAVYDALNLGVKIWEGFIDHENLKGQLEVWSAQQDRRRAYEKKVKARLRGEMDDDCNEKTRAMVRKAAREKLTEILHKISDLEEVLEDKGPHRIKDKGLRADIANRINKLKKKRDHLNKLAWN